VDKLQPLVASYRPELPLPIRHRTYKPSMYFDRGELPRVALAVLREAGAPPPICVIAAHALARKGCRTPTRRVSRTTRVRLQQLFGRLEARGITVKMGRGK
jgi:hypothetical protein